MSVPLALIPTGTANIASVAAAFRRLGLEPEISSEPSVIEGAQRVVLPGVGSFGASGSVLFATGASAVLKARVEEGKPTLAICVGMQLLAEGSEESPGAAGLGVIPGTLSRFKDEVMVPQIGWNRVDPESSCRFLVPGWAYFANSYRFDAAPSGWTTATTDHGGRFISAMERGQVLACQFHPELSGVWGLALLDRWISGGVG